VRLTKRATTKRKAVTKGYGQVAEPSLREGLEEMLTVIRLGVSVALRRTLAMTNPIESTLNVTRRVTGWVTIWRDGDMRKRWCAAGLLRAKAKFRRVKGRRAMPILLQALNSLVGELRAGSNKWLKNLRRNRRAFQVGLGQFPIRTRPSSIYK
jgi:hypothetical protein